MSSLDYLDPTLQDDEPDTDNPVKNPFEDPGARAFGGVVGDTAPSSPGHHEPDEVNLGEEEEAGESTRAQGGDASELNYINSVNPEKKAKSKNKTSGPAGKSSAAKKRIMYLVAGTLGTGTIVFLGFILFMFIAGFGSKQAAAVMDITNFSRLHYMSYRRTSQFVLEKSLNPDAEGFKVAKQSKSLIDRFQRFDPNKVLSTLRQEDQLVFVTKERTTKRFGIIGKDIPVDDLAYIRFGTSGGVAVPEKSGWNLVQNYRNQKEFAVGLEAALEESGVFAEKSRIFRTKTVNAILEASDIKLYRWVDQGRKIKTFKDSILSAYDRLKPKDKPNVTVDGADELDGAVDDALKGTADDAVGSAPQLVASAETKAVEKVAKNPAKVAAGKISVSVIVLTTYCTARDYIRGGEKSAENKNQQYKAAGAMVQSASSQIESGDTTMSAVMYEGKRWSNMNGSREYQEDVGNPQASQMEQDLDPSDSPTYKPSGFLYEALKKIKEGGDATTGAGLMPESLRDGFCGALTSTPGQIGTAVGENVITAILAAGSGGGAAAAKGGTEVAVQAGLKEVFMAGLSNFGRKEALQTATRSGLDIGMFFSIDLLLKHVMGRSGNAAADDGSTMYAKSDLGTKLLANETANTMGGRELSSGEVAQLNQAINDRRLAGIKKKPLLSRLASLSDPFSPASQAVATLPSSPSDLRDKSVAFLGGSANPISTIANNSNRLAFAASGSSGKAFATTVNDDDKERLGVPTIGFSLGEQIKMLEPAFWPAANANYVETREGQFDDIKDCFPLMTKKATPPCGADKLTSDHALHYRLYQYDGGNSKDDDSDSDVNDGAIGGLIGLQEVVAKSGSSSSSGTTTPGAIASDTSGTQCQGGSKDLGISTDLGPGYEAYSDGKLIKIRLCAVTTIKGSSDESNSSVKGVGVPGANGQAIVSSIASGAWQELGKRAQAAGKSLSAGSSWRTMAHQEQLCRDDKKNGGEGDCPNGNYNDVAQPGTSNHQSGTAIDISEIFAATGGNAATDATCSAPKTSTHPTYIWVAANARALGIKNYANEPWHWGTAEQC